MHNYLLHLNHFESLAEAIVESVEHEWFMVFGLVKV